MEYRQAAARMLEFIEKSPTCFHAVENAKKMLEAHGYQEWKETDEWEASYGGKYYTVRNGSSIAAFSIPEAKQVKGFHLVASHSDSPTFKVKEVPEMSVEKQYVKLNTEKYGGMILSTWMDRALSVAGRLVVKGEQGLESKLVNLDRDLLVIPNLAIHMNREINDGVKYNAQVDMLPLMACGEEGAGCKLLSLAAAEAGVAEEEILGHELYLYPREKGRFLGAGEELILSPRLDDLQSAYASLEAMVESTPKEYINVCVIFDNEEVGSSTKQGADSTFLEDAMIRCCEALGISQGNYRRLVAGSFLISADNAHAVHPNHPEKADPTNRPYLNGGIVIKFHGSQKYTSDAFSGARMKDLCNRAGVPYQTFANRSDAMGGSTLGNISTAHVSVSSVDIGLPQLSMHSAVETGGTKDTLYCIKALQEFYSE